MTTGKPKHKSCSSYNTKTNKTQERNVHTST